MASSFLEKKAKKQAEELEKKYGSSAYGGTTWLNNQLSGKKASNNDIAPVNTKKKKDEEEDKPWYKSGLFEDGYDFGDVSKTILGLGEDKASLLDLTWNSAERGFYNARYGEETYKAMTGQKNQKEAVEAILADDKYDFAPGSTVGKAVSGAFELLGQQARQWTHPRSLAAATGAAGAAALAGQAGPQVLAPEEIITVPGAFIAGMTAGSAGTNYEIEAGHAYNEMLEAGISEETAKKVAVGVGGINAALELVQLDELTDAYKVLSKTGTADTAIKRIAKELLDRGVDIAKETAQEVAQEGVTITGTQMASKLDKGEWAYNADEVTERLGDTAISSALSFGMMNAPAAVKNTVAIAKDQKATTSLTDTEKAVVKKVIEDRVAEQEENGVTLTTKEKAAIEKGVLRELEKGYISTDTIEEVLGDRSAYDSLAKEAEEYDTLYNTPSGQLSKAQQDRLTELDSKNKANPYKDALNVAKDQYSQSVLELVKGDRLSESYNERARRGQVFEADLTQYDAKQQAVIQKAIDSGILNNTNRTHEFVDMIAKISADKGVLFDFTNNAKLKDSGFAVDGKAVNGYVTKDGVTLNIDSAKSLNSVVGHEITHVLEGTELYDVLKQTVFDYAKSKGEYDSRLSALTETYKSVKDADIDAELAADLVGDYLFTDSDFIHRLSTENRNVFQKIYDEIKYLYKVATAGSKEARELERVKKAFEDAYRANGKAQGGTKHSLSAEQQEYFKDSKVRDESGNLLPVYHGSKNSGFNVFRYSKDVQTGTDYGEAYYFTSDHQKASGYSYDVTKDERVAKYNADREALKKRFLETHSEEDKNAFLNYRYDGKKLADLIDDETYSTDGGEVKEVYLNLTNPLIVDAGGKYYYEVYQDYFEKARANGNDGIIVKNVIDNPRGEARPIDTYIAFYPEQIKNTDNLKPTSNPDIRYSLSDTDGKQLTNEQQEFFKDSKMRDENGNLKVMYHGSQDAGFHVFDPGVSDDGISLFFVDRNDVAASYSGTSETYEAKTIRSAEDMNNFLAEIGYDQYEAVERNGKFELLEDGDHVATSDTAQGIYEEFCWYEGVGDGDANYKVYLNLKNPLEVDAKGRPWNKIDAEFSQEVYDKYNSLTKDEKDALIDLAGWEDFRIFNSEIQEARGNELASAYEKMGEDCNIYDLFSVAADNFSEEAMRENSRKYLKTRDYAQRAKEQGYDGVIFKNIIDNGGYSNGSEGASTVAIAFDSNQIKSTANVKPTGDPDIRYSLSEDSNGNKLSKEQAKYFKNSKAVDDNGNLKVLYHGSPKDFNTFSLEYLGTNGTAEGYGFYFTDKKHIAEGYSRGYEGQQNGEPGKLFECYLDIKKPLSDTKVTMTRAQFKKFLTELNNQVDADGDPLDVLSNYGDVEWEGLNKVLNYAMEIEYDGSDSDVNLVHSIINGCGNMEVVFDVLRKTVGYDGIIVNEASWGGDQTIYIAFHPEQIKNIDNLNPTSDPDIRRSLSEAGEQPRRYGDYNIYGKDIALESEEVAPVEATTEATTVSEKESVAPVVISKNETTTPVTPEEMRELFPDDLAPTQTELDSLLQEKEALEGRMLEMANSEDFTEFDAVTDRYAEVMSRIEALDKEVSETEADRIGSLSDEDAPMEREPVRGYDAVTAEDPFADRSETEVGNRSVKAYQYENPEVKPFFREAAYALAEDINLSIPAERWYNDDLYYASGGEQGFGGNSRLTAKDVGDFKDQWKCSWDDLREAVNDIIEDHGKENNALAKRVEFLINDRLMYGYTNIRGERIEPNQAYLDFLKEKQINEYSKEAREAFFANAEEYAPFDIAPVAQAAAPTVDDVAPVKAAPVREAYEAIRPKREPQPKLAKATPQEQASASVLVEEPKVEKNKPGLWSMFKDNIVDKGTIFETLSLKTGNRELQGRWKSIGRAESSAQWFMEHGNASTSSLKTIRDTVEKSGKTQQFYEYLYHLHNVDRMNLEDRYEDVVNKPVFGYDVTSEMSREAAAKLEAANPEFKAWSKEVYDYMTYLREMMVDSGVISHETAKLWAEMYPHYVPVRRKGDEGLNINVALDTRRTGVNAPVKRATGGNRDILPLFDTMAMRTEQTFKAVARNRFGVTLKNMLGTTIENEAVDIDEAIDSVENEELLQEGKNGRNPTFTVFDKGEKVTFEITDEMYDTMKPKSKAMGYTNKVLNTANNIRRGLLTEYNPVFMLTNPIKDTQDVVMNSQHPARTYANYPKAIAELLGKKGQYYQEYMEHGGEQNTYFDGEAKTFVKEKSGLSKVIGFPLEKISQANNFIERIPRMAEYIASRKEGRSIDVSMLDAARVTTDFSAGGDLVKWANRNGFTFLNASVQGAVQQVRNVREAKAEGLKGWAKLAAKVAVSGLPAILLNHLLWDDDEEYAELSDYVKQNYYIVGKYGDGKFVRIPKGRTLAVIQNAFEQMENLVTGNDEVDLEAFGELVISNLAPSNPLENNLIAPITQAMKNTTWYGDDLVPTRLQDLPAAEQFDETTDSVSKWLGEKLNLSPYKINYVLDQYSGAIGDVFLPMLTPEAERGTNTLLAPISDKFTTDSVMKNQNISDFYDKKGELTTNAKASGATAEDVLMNKYMNSINSELSELYAEKRRIQNTNLSDAEKYEAVREIQKQIVDLTSEGLATYDDIDYQTARDGEYANIGNRYFKLDDEGEWQKLSDEQATKYKVTSAAGDSTYASDGTNHYRWYEPGEDASEGAEPGWRKVTEKELERQNEVTSGLGISPEEYWGNKEEYGYAYDNPESYAVAKAVGGYAAYKQYSSDLYDIKADKDEYGKSISGSRKEKVQDYINSLDADYYTKLILFKSEYTSYDDENYEIIEYLNGREDISFEEEVNILKKLGFSVDAEGNVSWD